MNTIERGKLVRFYDELKGFWSHGIVVHVDMERQTCGVNCGTGVVHVVPVKNVVNAAQEREELLALCKSSLAAFEGDEQGPIEELRVVIAKAERNALGGAKR